MSTFITRIELHAATYQQYETLHKEMAVAGFRRTILGNDGVTYHLPTAEYACLGEFMLEAVFNAAKAAASKVGVRFAVLCNQTASSMWIGLTQAR